MPMPNCWQLNVTWQGGSHDILPICKFRCHSMTEKLRKRRQLFMPAHKVPNGYIRFSDTYSWAEQSEMSVKLSGLHVTNSFASIWYVRYLDPLHIRLQYIDNDNDININCLARFELGKMRIYLTLLVSLPSFLVASLRIYNKPWHSDKFKAIFSKALGSRLCTAICCFCCCLN